MIDPISKMRELKYGTLSKERRGNMKRHLCQRLISFDIWLKIITFLLLLSLSTYLSIIIYEYYRPTETFYEIIYGEEQDGLEQAGLEQEEIIDSDDIIFFEDLLDEDEEILEIDLDISNEPKNKVSI